MCKRHYTTAIKIIFALALSSNLFAMEGATMVDAPRDIEKGISAVFKIERQFLPQVLKETWGRDSLLLPTMPEKRISNESLPLLEVAKLGDVAWAEILFQVPVETEVEFSDGANALHVAVECNHLALVKFLLDKGFDVERKDLKGFTPLLRAAYYGHVDIVKLLKEYGASLRAEFHIEELDVAFTAVDIANLNEKPAVAELLTHLGVTRKQTN